MLKVSSESMSVPRSLTNSTLFTTMRTLFSSFSAVIRHGQTWIFSENACTLHPLAYPDRGTPQGTEGHFCALPTRGTIRAANLRSGLRQFNIFDRTGDRAMSLWFRNFSVRFSRRFGITYVIRFTLRWSNFVIFQVGGNMPKPKERLKIWSYGAARSTL